MLSEAESLTSNKIQWLCTSVTSINCGTFICRSLQSNIVGWGFDFLFLFLSLQFCCCSAAVCLFVCFVRFFINNQTLPWSSFLRCYTTWGVKIQTINQIFTCQQVREKLRYQLRRGYWKRAAMVFFLFRAFLTWVCGKEDCANTSHVLTIN